MSDELKDQRIPVMMSRSEVKAIDDWSFAHRIRSRASAIRILIQQGLIYERTAKLADDASEMLVNALLGEELNAHEIDEKILIPQHGILQDIDQVQKSLSSEIAHIEHRHNRLRSFLAPLIEQADQIEDEKLREMLKRTKDL